MGLGQEVFFIRGTSLIRGKGLVVVVVLRRSPTSVVSRSDFKHMRVGCSEASSAHQQVGDRWKNLPPEQKAMFEERAKQMQEARTSLMQQPLRAKESHDVLNKGQLQSLNNSRLDPTWPKVSGHSAWKSGLSLGDHICALRPELVWGSDCPKEVVTALQEVLTYDAFVAASGTLPSFQQPCISTGGGVCKQDALYPFVESLAKELDSAFLQAK